MIDFNTKKPRQRDGKFTSPNPSKVIEKASVKLNTENTKKEKTNNEKDKTKS